MATYNNTTTYLTGGTIYSNNAVLSTNQSQAANYFPPTTAYTDNNTLGSLQDSAQALASANTTTDAAGACYDVISGQSFDYLP